MFQTVYDWLFYSAVRVEVWLWAMEQDLSMMIDDLLKKQKTWQPVPTEKKTVEEEPKDNRWDDERNWL